LAVTEYTSTGERGVGWPKRRGEKPQRETICLLMKRMLDLRNLTVGTTWNVRKDIAAA
jgi:hypothetical protein